ncbi:MAG: hypothetical protein V1775_14130 [Bacteroidota bacterium]
MQPLFEYDKSADECQEKGRMLSWISAPLTSGLTHDRMIFSFLIIMLLAGCGQQKATRERSRKTLKAFDYELIKISNNLSKTEAFDALLFVRKLPGVQLPFLTSNDTIPGTETETFNIEHAKGIYQYQSVDSLPVKIADADSLIILFDDKNSPGNSYRLVIGSYIEKLTALGMVFPEILEANFYKNNHMIGNIHYKASFRYGMPEDINVAIKAGRFGINIKMETTFRRKKSDLEVRFDVTEDSRLLIKGYVQSDIVKTSSNTLTYNDKEIELEIFPLKLKLESDFRFMQSENNSFFNGFNRHSRINLTDNEGVSLGHVKLEQVPGRTRVNLIMYYHDNSSENLEDFMLSVDRILNMKTSFPRW